LCLSTHTNLGVVDHLPFCFVVHQVLSPYFPLVVEGESTLWGGGGGGGGGGHFFEIEKN
jgi:hypothetical protein